MRSKLPLAAAILLFAAPLRAEEKSVPAIADPLVRQECGSCHMAFQPVFLPARSWNRIMDELANHFGEDASLPPDKAQRIRAYLTANAGDAAGGGWARRYMRWVAESGTPLRITANPAFERKHRLPDAVWKDPKVVTKSNCPACHTQAEKGWFDDD